MIKSKPFSKSVRSNLLSVIRDEKSLNLFRQLTLTELQNFRAVRSLKYDARPSPFSIELEKLNALVRLLKKHPLNIDKILAGTSDLHISTQEFLGFEVKKLLNFDLNTISKRSASENRKTALTALENTRIYFRDLSGSRYSTEDLNLVRALANIYKTASGKRFGVGSSSTTLGPDYMTRGEKFLYAALKLANRHITIEGMRELYRAAHRHKKGTKKPAAKSAKTPAN